LTAAKEAPPRCVARAILARAQARGELDLAAPFAAAPAAFRTLEVGASGASAKDTYRPRSLSACDPSVLCVLAGARREVAVWLLRPNIRDL